MGLLDRLQHAWNAFIGLDPQTDTRGYYQSQYINYGQSFTYRPDKLVLARNNERSIIGAIYNRIAVDCSSINIRHVKTDENGRYTELIEDGLNECFSLEANKDQTSKMFIRDIVISLFDEGCIALVPVETDTNINLTNGFDIYSIRVGKITRWYPDHVALEVYNDKTGNKVNLTLPKSKVAIIENPLWAIMNEPNSTLQRLVHKLALLDVIDEQSGSGKLDLIIQLPYVIKTEARRKQAEDRRADIESQLKGSKYGIAYTDGTEHITQLNRPVENNLMKQIEYLTSMLYSQLGLTDTILNGTADEKTMLNYMNRTVKPVMDAIVDEVKRKFLTRTARTQRHTIMYFNDPFKLVPIANLADIADKFTRNAIMSSNEFRQIVGLKPVSDPKADELSNKNLNQPDVPAVDVTGPTRLEKIMTKIESNESAPADNTDLIREGAETE